MSVQSITRNSFCHKFYNNVIQPLYEKIKNLVSSIFNFIKNTFSKIFCCKKKKNSKNGQPKNYYDVDPSLYDLEETFFSVKKIFNTVKKYETAIKKNNFPRKNLFVDIKKGNKPIEKIQSYKDLSHNYNLSDLRFPHLSSRIKPYFKLYLMSLCDNLAIIHYPIQYVKFKAQATQENYLDNFTTTQFPENKKYIAIFFSIKISTQGPHANLVFINRETKEIYYYDPFGRISTGLNLNIFLETEYLQEVIPENSKIIFELTVPKFLKLLKKDFEEKDGKPYTLIENKIQYQDYEDNFNCTYFCSYEVTRILIENNLIGKKILPPLKGCLKKKFRYPEYPEFLDVLRKKMVKDIFENPIIISNQKHKHPKFLDKCSFIKEYPSS